MEGSSHLFYLDRPEDGEYNITMPNMYARGILFGKVGRLPSMDVEVGADRTPSFLDGA